MVLDVGNWDASRTINTPGQLGDPFSAQYRDLFPLCDGGHAAGDPTDARALAECALAINRLDFRFVHPGRGH